MRRGTDLRRGPFFLVYLDQEPLHPDTPLTAAEAASFFVETVASAEAWSAVSVLPESPDPDKIPDAQVVKLVPRTTTKGR